MQPTLDRVLAATSTEEREALMDGQMKPMRGAMAILRQVSPATLPSTVDHMGGPGGTPGQRPDMMETMMQ